MALVPAELAFVEGLAYSDAYDDVYHSAAGAAGQAEHVFLAGCGLPERWANQPSFAILETGFGTGLNFLVTWAAWRADPHRPARLDFLSVEKHPFRVADLAELHARWPQFAELSAELLAAWPPLVPGFHRVSLDAGQVRLTLLFGDALDLLPQVDARIDAIYLDGFSPDRNADLWSPPVFEAIAERAKPGALAATYSVAGVVKQGLAAAGFSWNKRPGYGGKRKCLQAMRVGGIEASASAAPRSIAVIGAGVAGASAAHALKQRGLDVTVFDAAVPGAGASGNPVAVFRPVLARADTPTVRLTRAAFVHDLAHWGALPGVEWVRCGVLHLAKNEADAVRLSQALAFHAPPHGFAHAVSRDEAVELAGWPVADGGVFYPDSGWVVPASLLASWLAGIGVRAGVRVAALREDDDGWSLLDAGGALLATVDAVVLANAADVETLCPDSGWPFTRVRGQVTRFGGDLPKPNCVVAREGYVAPAGDGLLVGATYEHDDVDTTPSAASDAANLERLYGLLPGVVATTESVAGHRAALRATLPDRLPMVGAVPGREGLWVAAGYASRGVVWAGLLAEALADSICAAPAPVERDLAAALDPARFSARSRSRA